VVLIGLFLGRALLRQRRLARLAAWPGGGPAARLLALTGRHGLAIYLLHQPLLMAALWTLLRVVRAPGA
jgi:uncharacterized membrane protein